MRSPVERLTVSHGQRRRSRTSGRSFANYNIRIAKRYGRWMIAMHYAKITQGVYRKTIRQFIEFLGRKSVATVTHVDIQEFIARISEDGATLDAVYRALGVLRVFYDFLNLGGVVGYVAPRYVRLRRPWWSRPAPLTESDIQRLITATQNPRERGLVELFYATGCRLTEVAQLRIEDVDLDARTARILGKGGKFRTVLLTRSAVDAIQNYVGDRKKGPVFLEERRVPTGSLITHRSKWVSLCRDYGDGPSPVIRRKCLGRVDDLPYETAKQLHKENVSGYTLVRHDEQRALSKTGIQVIVKTLAIRAGLKKVTPHTFRRTFATHLYNNGASAEIIQALMGHAELHTTLRYVQIGPDKLSQTFDRCHPRGRLNEKTQQ